MREDFFREWKTQLSPWGQNVPVVFLKGCHSDRTEKMRSEMQ